MGEENGILEVMGEKKNEFGEIGFLVLCVLLIEKNG